MSGTGKCECTVCGEVFRSAAGFDMHRIGTYGEPIYKTTSKGKRGDIIAYTKPNRRCMTEQEMLAKGMVKNDKGQWVTEAYDKSIVHKDDETEEAGEEAAD